MTTPPSTVFGSERGFGADLTLSANTWLANPPDAQEQARLTAARKTLAAQQGLADQLLADEPTYIQLSLALLREPQFAPLHFAPWVVEQVIQAFGEPPVVEDEADPAFSDYLRQAVVWLGTSRVRRTMAEHARRFVPALVDAGRIREALALERNAYLTVMSEAATPLLVQMLVAALANWYEAHDTDADA